MDVKSTGEMAIQSTADFRLQSEANMDIHTATSLKIASLGTAEINGGTAIRQTAGTIDLNSAGAVATIAVVASAETANVPPAPTPTPVEPAALADQAARVPQHEPWYEHEHLNPAIYTPDKTRANTHQEQTFVPRNPDTFAKTIGVPIFGQQTTPPPPRTNATGETGVSTSCLIYKSYAADE